MQMATDNVHLFLFSRDLRVKDNIGLAKLRKHVKETYGGGSRIGNIIPLFIFNPVQIDPAKNAYYSPYSVDFMLTCLEKDMPKETVYMEEDVIAALTRVKKDIEGNGRYLKTIGFNEDYTPFAAARTEAVKQWAEENGVTCITAKNDFHLFNIKKPYKVFTPYWKACLAAGDVKKPLQKNDGGVDFLYPFPDGAVKKKPYTTVQKMRAKCPTKQSILKGGREVAMEIVGRIKRKEFANYEEERNYPALDKTTHLSPYIKFGCLSIREVFHALTDAYGKEHGLPREIVWREFYIQLVKHYPYLLQGKTMRSSDVAWGSLKEKEYAEYFEKWKEGQTGFPIVDAAMRYMKATGYMNNRLRMIVSTFLTKDALVSWKEGERYFAQSLVDYDPASNNGGWQWSASVGADSQPYFRIFNPWLQSKKFDGDAAFILEWVPELKGVPTKHIHAWDKWAEKYHAEGVAMNYPVPMLDHGVQSKKAIQLFKTGV